MKPRRKSITVITPEEVIKREQEHIRLITKLATYEKYVGCFAKRFYQPFLKEHILKILKYRLNKFGIPEFLLGNDDEEQNWYDIEDLVIITDESPMIKDERVANINNPEYTGYNPYKINYFFV